VHDLLVPPMYSYGSRKLVLTVDKTAEIVNDTNFDIDIIPD
jgi:hypothetical protein